MTLHNRLFILILFTLVFSTPEVVAPQVQLDEISQRALIDLISEIDQPTVELPARIRNSKQGLHFLFVPPSSLHLFSADRPRDKFQFFIQLKNHYLVSANARGPPLT